MLPVIPLAIKIGVAIVGAIVGASCTCNSVPPTDEKKPDEKPKGDGTIDGTVSEVNDASPVDAQPDEVNTETQKDEYIPPEKTSDEIQEGKPEIKKEEGQEEKIPEKSVCTIPKGSTEFVSSLQSGSNLCNPPAIASYATPSIVKLFAPCSKNILGQQNTIVVCSAISPTTIATCDYKSQIPEKLNGFELHVTGIKYLPTENLLIVPFQLKNSTGGFFVMTYDSSTGTFVKSQEIVFPKRTSGMSPYPIRIDVGKHLFVFNRHNGIDGIHGELIAYPFKDPTTIDTTKATATSFITGINPVDMKHTGKWIVLVLGGDPTKTVGQHPTVIFMEPNNLYQASIISLENTILKGKKVELIQGDSSISDDGSSVNMVINDNNTYKLFTVQFNIPVDPKIKPTFKSISTEIPLNGTINYQTFKQDQAPNKRFLIFSQTAPSTNKDGVLTKVEFDSNGNPLPTIKSINFGINPISAALFTFNNNSFLAQFYESACGAQSAVLMFDIQAAFP